MNKSIWDDPLVVEELLDCINKKLSGNVTAETMGLTLGQVTGKTHRMGLKFQSEPGHKRKKSGGKTSTSWKPRVEITQKFPYREALPMAPEKPLEPLNLTLWQLSDSPIFTECRWITNEDMKAALYCGLPVAEEGCSWCSGHRTISKPANH